MKLYYIKMVEIAYFVQNVGNEIDVTGNWSLILISTQEIQKFAQSTSRWIYFIQVSIYLILVPD